MLMKTFFIKTPDNDSLSINILGISLTDSVLKDNLTLADEKFQLKNGHKIYFNKEKKYFIELLPNRFSYKFTYDDFVKYKDGINYWKTSIFLTEEDSVYFSFSLRPDKVKDFLNLIVNRLEAFKAFDRYEAYVLISNEVLFSRPRVNNLYDAYWFPTIKDFEFCYKSFAY